MGRQTEVFEHFAIIAALPHDAARFGINYIPGAKKHSGFVRCSLVQLSKPG